MWLEAGIVESNEWHETDYESYFEPNSCDVLKKGRHAGCRRAISWEKGRHVVPTVAELTDTCRVLQAKQTDLDRCIIALPRDDLEGRNTLMAELEAVMTDLHDSVRQLSRIRAHDVAALRSKAAVIVGIGKQDTDLLAELSLSLAHDVEDVLGST
jgi:hypothetical protein